MFNLFKKDKEPENIKEVLDYVKNLEKKLDKTTEALGRLKQDSKFFVQKLGIVRYNPFSGVGGNQSFSVALLDGNNDGVVVTNLYSRDGSMVYAKSIKNGNSNYALSKEEKEAVSKAFESGSSKSKSEGRNNSK